MLFYLVDRASHLPTTVDVAQVAYPDEILCVTHASVPETGGYAIRAHEPDITANAGMKITAVTRPGFQLGP